MYGTSEVECKLSLKSPLVETLLIIVLCMYLDVRFYELVISKMKYSIIFVCMSAPVRQNVIWIYVQFTIIIYMYCTVVKIINVCFCRSNRTPYYRDMFIKDNEEVNEQNCGIYRKGEKEVIIYILYILYTTVLYKM